MYFWIKRTASIFLAGTILAFICYLHAGGPANPFPEERDYPYYTSRSCRQCHKDIYEEWSSSFHARSWKDPLVHSLSKGFDNADCIPCHAPQPVLLSTVGSTPVAREKMRKTGVNCLSCHRVKKGVATARQSKNAPCRPVEDDRISDTVLCRSCHNLHGTVDDWEATLLKAEGRDCLSCHMPMVQRKDGTRTRSHRWPGGHSREMIARAVSLNSKVENGKLLVEVENRGAGHNVPTELRHRALDLQVILRTGLWKKKTYEFRFRNPYKGEGGPNTQLKFGERQRFEYKLPSGDGEAIIRLVYRLMPHGRAGKGEVVHEKSLPFHQNKDKNP